LFITVPIRAYQVRAHELAGVGRAADRDAVVLERDRRVPLDLEGALRGPAHVLPFVGDVLQRVAERHRYERRGHELFVRDLEVPGGVGDAGRAVNRDLDRDDRGLRGVRAGRSRPGDR